MKIIEPGLIGLLVFTPGIILMVIAVCVAHYYIDKIESLLQGSTYIRRISKAFSGAGLPGKILRTFSVACMLTMPGPYARRGLVDMREIKAFPVKLKRVLIGLWLAITVEVISMLAFRAWLYLL